MLSRAPGKGSAAGEQTVQALQLGGRRPSGSHLRASSEGNTQRKLVRNYILSILRVAGCQWALGTPRKSSAGVNSKLLRFTLQLVGTP